MASLPNAPYPRYQYRATPNDVEYLFTFHYADTLGRWTMTIAERDDSADIVAGIAVVYGLNLLDPVQHLVPGTLTITATDPRTSFPTLESFTQDLERLVYVAP